MSNGHLVRISQDHLEHLLTSSFPVLVQAQQVSLAIFSDTWPWPNYGRIIESQSHWKGWMSHHSCTPISQDDWTSMTGWLIRINSMSPGRCITFFENIISNDHFLWTYLVHLLWNWTGIDANNLQSTLVQVMAWCHQATSHYRSPCFDKYICYHTVSLGCNEFNIWLHKCCKISQNLISYYWHYVSQSHFPSHEKC